MIFHSKSKEEVLKSLSSDMSKGLSSKKVEEIREQYGLNKLSEKKKKSSKTN